MPLTFRRIAGAFHPVLATLGDLYDLMAVPDAHWIATSAPTLGLACDPRLLSLLDEEGDGRVRAEEVRAAIAWVRERVAAPERWRAGSDTLDLEMLGPAGAAVRRAAQLALDAAERAAGYTETARRASGDVRYDRFLGKRPGST
jgi:hypothetical protein